jgi:hypothetical protein
MNELLLQHYKNKICIEYYEIMKQNMNKSFNCNVYVLS